MDKVIRDGNVAILYSPGFGAGWYTWNREYPECLYDPDIVAAIESNDRNKAAILAEAKWENFYTGGAEDLEVEWLPEGTSFSVDEYDGSESIVTTANLELNA
jgi:hypothetical protein